MDKRMGRDAVSHKINEVVLKHLKRLNRIRPDETVERVQSYLGGMKISFSDPVDERSTLYLELGNQSSGAFAYQTDDFLRDLSTICGQTVDNIFVIETEFDIRNKEHCLATVAFHFGHKVLSEWCAGNGEGLTIDITTRQWTPSNEWTVVKAIHIRRLTDGTSSVTVELPELYDAFDRVIRRNFGKRLVQWMKEDIKVSEFDMEPNEKTIQSILNRFKKTLLSKEPAAPIAEIPAPKTVSKVVGQKDAA